MQVIIQEIIGTVAHEAGKSVVVVWVGAGHINTEGRFHCISNNPGFCFMSPDVEDLLTWFLCLGPTAATKRCNEVMHREDAKAQN